MHQGPSAGLAPPGAPLDARPDVRQLRWPPWPACRSSSTASSSAPAAASPAPITIAYITDLTGEGGSEDASSPAGFEARIDMQNAEGGVNGHKLVPLVIDDQTSPSDIATAVQEADSKAFGIVSQSPLFFLAAKYPQPGGRAGDRHLRRRPRVGHAALHQHVRLGRGQRRPEVPGQHPDRRLPQGARRHGARLVRLRDLAVVQPGRQRDRGLLHSTPGARSACWTPRSPSAAWPSPASHWWPSRTGVNAMVPAMDANSNYALAEALKQAGVKLKATLYATGYQPDVINSPAWSTLQGGYFLSPFRPWAAPQRGHRADAGRHGEVRPLHQEPVPEPSASTRRGRAPT